MFSAVLIEDTVVVCVTGPSSPGLRTLTEIEMLQPAHPAGDDGAVDPVPQSQFQFHTHWGDDDVGDIVLGPSEASEQFHCQFHTQFTEGNTLGSGRAT
jgi:hypothetical protein